MMPQRLSALRARAVGVGACRGLPSDWWDTGDDGNRLALAICRACPERIGDVCRAGMPDATPTGVVRAGVAYNDRGTALPLCECGYPQVAYAGGTVAPCPRCLVPDVPIPDRQEVRARALRLLLAAGATDTEIAVELRVSVRQAGRLRRSAGLSRRKSRPAVAPQAATAGSSRSRRLTPERTSA